jgi:hypothetical protein
MDPTSQSGTPNEAAKLYSLIVTINKSGMPKPLYLKLHLEAVGEGMYFKPAEENRFPFPASTDKNLTIKVELFHDSRLIAFSNHCSYGPGRKFINGEADMELDLTGVRATRKSLECLVCFEGHNEDYNLSSVTVFAKVETFWQDSKYDLPT